MDKNTNKVEITYIKNGQEVIKEIPENEFWNSNEVYMMVCDKLVRVASDIELLHIKNLHCNSNISFYCSNEETILIFDECYFTNDTTFGNGSISMNNTQFIDNIAYIGMGEYKEETTNLLFQDCENVQLILNERSSKDIFIHTCEIVDCKNFIIAGNTSHIQIKNHNTVNHKLYPLKNIQLRNAKNFTFNNLTAENIVIEDSNNIEFNKNKIYNRLKISNSTVNIVCNFIGHNIINIVLLR